jgi:mercuric ion binding protein
LRSLPDHRQIEPGSRSGVEKVVVSFTEKKAVVTFDEQKTTLLALMAATVHAGYPSSVKG